MDDFYNVAMMLIYPDGYVDEIYIDKEVLHSYYYKELAKKSSRFAEFVKKRNIDINEFFYTTNVNLVNLDKIIVINNIDIARIVNIKGFLDKNIPDFLFNLPDELTEEQKNILFKLFDDYYLCNAGYGHPKEGKIEPVNYYEILNSLYESKSKR